MVRKPRSLLMTSLFTAVVLTACHSPGPAAAAEAEAAPPTSPAPAAAEAEAPPAAPEALAEDPEPTAKHVDDTTLASAVVAAAVEDKAAEAEPVEATPPAEPFKVLILGDSLAATGFGALLEKQLDAHPNVVCYRKGKSASGLARPDFFDWMAEGKRQTDLRKPDLVIAIMGGNDGQDLTRKRKSEGRRVPWKHENWSASYRERMDAFLQQVGGDDRKVLWLGLPTMGLRSLEKKLETIRAIQKEAVEAVDGAVYLETAPFVSTEDGKMLTHAEVGKRKKRQKLRAEDKIHFTMSGSQYFAGMVYPEVLNVLELDDGEPDAAE